MADASPTPKDNGWNDCDAHARFVDGHGHESRVRCDMGRHAAPDEAEQEHHDPDLGIFWRYDDDLIFEDDDE
jgi:hypothetical protein